MRTCHISATCLVKHKAVVKCISSSRMLKYTHNFCYPYQREEEILRQVMKETQDRVRMFEENQRRWQQEMQSPQQSVVHSTIPSTLSLSLYSFCLPCLTSSVNSCPDFPLSFISNFFSRQLFYQPYTCSFFAIYCLSVGEPVQGLGWTGNESGVWQQARKAGSS